ncbi:MAG: hypothetical protein ACHQHO_02290 [Solirubrobacterales bacterium]
MSAEVEASSRPAVVHLVWAPLGRSAVHDFLASYRAHDAGAAHDLAIVLNGAGVGAAGNSADGILSREQLLLELDGTPHRLIELDRPVLDLVAYGAAVRTLGHQRVCLVNSHSRIRCDGWLAALEEALRPSSVGVVGASGSWAGLRSYALYHLRLPSPYRHVWQDHSKTLSGFRELAGERAEARSGRGPRARLSTLRGVAEMLAYGPPFPSPHLRTNVIMAERALLARLLPDRLTRKVHAYQFESGSKGLTRRMLSMGLRAQVVDRDGRAYEPEEWPESETFWQGAQDGLMVADNQTEAYRRGDLDRRLLLSRFAWGERAAPR